MGASRVRSLFPATRRALTSAPDSNMCAWPEPVSANTHGQKVGPGCYRGLGARIGRESFGLRLRGSEIITMSAPHPIRPCAEFPNDNDDLHAGSRWLLADPLSSVTALLPNGPSIPFEAARLLVPTQTNDQTGELAVALPPDAPETTLTVLEAHALDATTPPRSDFEPIVNPALEDPFLVELLPFVEQLTCESAATSFIDETPTQKLRPWSQSVQPLVPLHFELTPLPPQVSEWSELITVLADYLLTRGHTRASALIGPLLNAELVDLSRLDSAVIQHLETDGIACSRGTRVVSSPSFRSSAHVLREELGNGGLDTHEAMFWLAQLVGALMGGQDEHEVLEATLRHLGIDRLIERAA